MNTEAVKAELSEIASGGLINPLAVVERARDPDSALHEHFTWDDGDAAEKWRLEEARKLIRVFVVTLAADGNEPVRAFVSLSSDRKSGGGYRALIDVLGDDDLRAQMLADALAELNAFKSKYSRLSELAPVFKAAEKAERKYRPKKRPDDDRTQAAA